MSGYEPVLHALSVEPRAARPGETVRLVFRTRNLGALPSPAATVRFAPAAGLEPLDPLAVELAPVAPGAELVAVLRARVVPGLDDRCELGARAALELAGGPLGTNACTLLVRSRPRLDGPGGGVAVSALDGEIVRVRAVVVNEGDGPAHDVRLVVPVPLGCVPLEGEAATQLALARLGVGERAELAYDARIVAPVAAVRAEGYVGAGGIRCALPVRSALALAPVLAAPRVALVPSRRRVDVAVELRNDGWVDARDVRVRVALPAPLRLLAESIVVDGVPLDGEANGFARVERVDESVVGRNDAGTAIVVARVPARGSVRVALAAQVPPACAGGTIGVEAGGHDVAVPFVAAQVREVRLRVADAPRVVEPGAALTVVAELANAGDLPETLTLAARGARFGASSGRLVSTNAPDMVIMIRARHGRDERARSGRDGHARWRRAGSVHAAGRRRRRRRCVAEADARRRRGQRATRNGAAPDERASCELVLVVRDRAWLVVDELPVRADGRVTYALRNAGTTTARAVVARFGDETQALDETRALDGTYALDPIAPGATATFAVSERAARRGGCVRVAGRDVLTLPPLDERPPAAVRAVLAAPASVIAGAPFAVRAEIEVDDAVEALALCVPAVAGAAYVPGSTSLDGRALLDRSHESPLAAPGLVLRGIPAGTCIRLTWSLLAGAAPADDVLALAAELAVDGEPREVTAVRVEVRAREAFAARPAGLPYHVDACTLAPDGALVPLPLAETPPSVALVSQPGRELAPVHLLEFDGSIDLEEPASEAVVLEPSSEPDVLEPSPVVAALAPVDAFTFTLRLGAGRLDEIARLLCGAERNGLVAHALALRAFFPDAETAADALLDDVLRGARHALRDVFDRLFVKVRIPGFDVTAADLEDPALRRALVRLYERLLVATPHGAAPHRAAAGSVPGGAAAGETTFGGSEPGVASVRLERGRVRGVLSSFADAPFGAPAMLRALVALVPTRCEAEPLLAAALARYAHALDAALARCEDAPSDAFDEALARGGDRALDDARADLLAALRARVALAA